MGHGRAGEDAHGLARPERAGVSGTGLGRPDDVEPGAITDIDGAHGVAIHGAGIERGLVVVGNKGFGQNPSGGFGQRDRFDRDGRDMRQNGLQRLIDRQEAHASRRKSPDLPPDFSTRQRSEITMARSMALAMS